MSTALLTAIAGLIGVTLGGGLRVFETWLFRRAEAKSLLSALVAEVEALTRLARHRRFYEALAALHAIAKAQIESGAGDQPCQSLMISMKQNYFSTFDRVGEKIGLIDAYKADRIMRFYVLAKAALENYDGNPFGGQVTDAHFIAEATLADMSLLRTLDAIGRDVMTFRKAKLPIELAALQTPALPLPPIENSPEAVHLIPQQ